LLAAGGAAAQTFPSKPVSLIVPYPAGGLSDAVARVIERPLGKALGQMVLVENIGGVGGAIAAQKMLAAPADGHMIYQGSPNELILTPMALQAVRYKSEEFRLVQIVGAMPMAVVARKDLAAENIDELVALARKAAAEGKPLTYGSVGVGSMYHVLGEHFAQQIDARMTHVPYKGGAPLVQAMLGNQVDIAFVSTPLILPHIKSGKVKAIATGGAKRLAQLPDLPTLGETFPGMQMVSWFGLLTPAGVPKDITARVRRDMARTLEVPEVRQKLVDGGFDVVASSPEEFLRFVQGESDKLGKLIRDNNIKVE
jgi:tripartite-type tricarboxylate transporter receptor subunit TctC